jgi:multidrug efflux pump subunit AcrB
LVGAGAVLAPRVFKTESRIIAMIGGILLIGIVQEKCDYDDRFCARSEAPTPRQAIFQACLLRFSIMMISMVSIVRPIPH